MLVFSWRSLEGHNETPPVGFETEYHWENFILRLWLYRTTVRTLAKLDQVSVQAKAAVETFDSTFLVNGKNQLKALRDMIEHFDDYAADQGRGPAIRSLDLDPWRTITRDLYERGQFILERKPSYDAAVNLRSDAKAVSSAFIQWHKARP